MRLYWAGLSSDGGDLYVAKSPDDARERAHRDFCDCHNVVDECLDADWGAVEVDDDLPEGQRVEVHELTPYTPDMRPCLWWVANDHAGEFLLAHDEDEAAAITSVQGHHPPMQVTVVDGYSIVAFIERSDDDA